MRLQTLHIASISSVHTNTFKIALSGFDCQFFASLWGDRSASSRQGSLTAWSSAALLVCSVDPPIELPPGAWPCKASGIDSFVLEFSPAVMSTLKVVARGGADVSTTRVRLEINGTTRRPLSH